MTRSKSQMTLDAWDEGQAQLGDATPDEPAAVDAPEPRALDDDTTSATRHHVRRLDDGTIAAVAPRGALDLLRTLEGAA